MAGTPYLADLLNCFIDFVAFDFNRTLQCEKPMPHTVVSGLQHMQHQVVLIGM